MRSDELWPFAKIGKIVFKIEIGLSVYF